MATYAELDQAAQNDLLRLKVRVACIIAAEAIRNEAGTTPNNANRLLWAKRVFAHPVQESERMLWAVLAQNQGATLAQITGASDSAVQSAVNSAVNVFATGTD